MKEAPVVRDYNEPDPPLPQDGSINDATKTVLELYANEIRHHASGITSIAGLTGWAAQKYKEHCFQAATGLEAAAVLLRQNNRWLVRQAVTSTGRPWSLLKAFLAGVGLSGTAVAAYPHLQPTLNAVAHFLGLQ